MPDIGNSLLRAEQIKQTRMQNQLAQQQMAERPGERNWLMEKRDMERQKSQLDKIRTHADIMKTALGANTPEAAKQIFQNAFPEEEAPDFSFVGPDVRVDAPWGTLEGKKSAVDEVYLGMKENPEFFMDPNNIKTAIPYMVRKGIKNITIKEPKTGRLFNLITGKVVEGAPGELEALKMQAPEVYQTPKERMPKEKVPLKPSEQISQMKLDAMIRRSEGKDTPADRRLLKDEGFWVSKAFEVIRPEMTDPRNRAKTSRYWSDEIIKAAKYLEQASGGAQGSGNLEAFKSKWGLQK